jgi:SOS-response transcriptional repressor LexA
LRKKNLCMRDIGKRIKERRLRLGWSTTKVATLAGISQSFLSRIENGTNFGSWETYLKIAGALGVSMDSLVTSAKSNVEHAEIGTRRVPVLDYVQAGQWTGVNRLPDEISEMQETIVTDLELPPSTFALRIRGESMQPEFRAGDIVVINPTIQPHPGDFVVATCDGGEATFKQYRSAGRNERGQDVFELWPLNPLYAPMRSDREPLAIVGVMVEHRKYLRR